MLVKKICQENGQKLKKIFFSFRPFFIRVHVNRPSRRCLSSVEDVSGYVVQQETLLGRKIVEPEEHAWA